MYEDVDTGERRGIILVYPDEADLERSLNSVLAPIGGRTRPIRVVSIDYQPEAAKDRHL